MMQLPTGGGKTVIAAHLLRGWLTDGAKAVWLTHRKELAQQTRKLLARAAVATAEVQEKWQSDDTAPVIAGGVVILMAQTVARREKRFEDIWQRYDRGDLLIVDEAHHATAEGWTRVICNWPGRTLGMTATPWRLSKREGFEHLFNKLICGPQVSELQNAMYLCRERVVAPTHDQEIIGGKVSRGDYTPSGIISANAERDVMTAGALRFWQQHAKDRQTIVYAVSVPHAQNLVAVFKDEGVSAALLLGDTEPNERAKYIRQFDNANIRALVNVEVATEGFDLPDASCVMMARPTMSLAMYLQMAGRGLRPKTNNGDCLILDLAGNTREHGLPSDQRSWSLAPRGTTSEGKAPVMRCKKCATWSPAANHHCRHCNEPFGKDCDRCGKWRAWRRWRYEDFCGDAHQLVCDFCHNDAHARAQIPIPEIEELVNLLDTEEGSEMDGEVADRLKPLLKELLEMERRAMVAEDEARKNELRQSTQMREALLSNDEQLDVAFGRYIAELPGESRPQNRTEERRRFVEWEDGLKADLERWRGEVDSLRNQPKDGVVFSNVQRKLSGLLSSSADEIGLTVGDNLVHQAIPPGVGTMTAVPASLAGTTRSASIEDGDVRAGDVLIHRFQDGTEARAQVVSVQQNPSNPTRPSVHVNSGSEGNISLAQAANRASGNMVNAWTWWKRANR